MKYALTNMIMNKTTVRPLGQGQTGVDKYIIPVIYIIPLMYLIPLIYLIPLMYLIYIIYLLYIINNIYILCTNIQVQESFCHGFLWFWDG